MKKSEALKKIIEKKKDEDARKFEAEVGSLVWAIEKKSQELRELKRELTELTYKETVVPDVSDCLAEGGE